MKKLENKIASEIILGAVHDYAKVSPETASEIGLPLNGGFWDPLDIASSRYEIVVRHAELLKRSVDFDILTNENKNAYRFLLYAAETAQFSSAETGRLNHKTGPQVRLPLALINKQPSFSEADLIEYTVRVGRFDGYIEGIIQLESQTAIRYPKESVSISREQCRYLVSKGSPLRLDFEEKLKLSSVKAGAQIKLKERFERSMHAVKEGCAHLVTYLNARSESVEGFVAVDPAIYKKLLYPDDPARLYNYATKEASRLSVRLSDTLMRDGIDPTALMREKFDERDAEVQRVLNEASHYIFEADARLSTFTTLMPSHDLDIKTVETFRARASNKIEYLRPSEGNPVATIYINPAIMGSREIEPLVYGSTLPGAHLVPLSPLSAMLETPRFDAGWVLYASQLPYPNPNSEIGPLLVMTEAAVRASIDTGLQTGELDLLKAKRRLLDSLPISDATADRILLDIRVAPGESAYAFSGAMKLLALREMAEARLGENFDLASFNDEVIKYGPLPLALIEENIESFIRGKIGTI